MSYYKNNFLGREMKYLLFALLLSLNLHALTVVEILGEERVNKLIAQNKSVDYIKKLAIEEYKKKFDQSNIKNAQVEIPKKEDMTKKKMAELKTKSLNEYCYKDMNVATKKGGLFYLDLCISLKEDYNKQIVHDKLLSIFAKKDVQDLLTLDGKMKLKKDIQKHLLVDKVYLSKFTIKKYNSVMDMMGSKK